MLRGACLAYHRDPAAEDAGLVDGIIDLSAAHTVHECEVARNYGFVIMVSNNFNTLVENIQYYYYYILSLENI